MRTPQQYPGIRMAQYGENPYAEPLYRIVFSDSCTDLQGGKWPDGAIEYREVPKYPGIQHQWLMERWLTPLQYAGTPAQYQKEQFDPLTNLLQCGPYPDRGVYMCCHIFVGEPTEMQIGWAVHNNKVSRDLTAGAVKQGIMEPLEQQQKQQDARFDDIFDDALGPFSNADTVISLSPSRNGRAGFKRPSDMPVERFDQSSPLPTSDNFFGQIRKQDTIARLTGE